MPRVYLFQKRRALCSSDWLWNVFSLYVSSVSTTALQNGQEEFERFVPAALLYNFFGVSFVAISDRIK